MKSVRKSPGKLSENNLEEILCVSLKMDMD